MRVCSSAVCFSMLSMCVLALTSPLRSIDLALYHPSTLISIYIPPKHHTNKDHSISISISISNSNSISYMIQILFLNVNRSWGESISRLCWLGIRATFLMQRDKLLWRREASWPKVRESMCVYIYVCRDKLYIFISI